MENPNPLRCFARRSIHVPSYNEDDSCVFCEHSRKEHKNKMKEIKKQLNGKLCDHSYGSYYTDGLNCKNCHNLIRVDK